MSRTRAGVSRHETVTANPHVTAPVLDDVAARTISEFCRRNRVSRTFAYGEIGAGRLRVVKAGRRTLVPVASEREWLARLPAIQPHNVE